MLVAGSETANTTMMLRTVVYDNGMSRVLLGVVLGGSGGLLVLIGVVVLVWFVVKKRREQQQQPKAGTGPVMMHESSTQYYRVGDEGGF